MLYSQTIGVDIVITAQIGNEYFSFDGNGKGPSHKYTQSLLTPARRNTSTVITISISSVPFAKIANALFVDIF